MKPDISEFSYGYALTEELTQKYKLIGAPEFPSLYQEGQEGGGYDLKIPKAIPIFIQFKLSHLLTTRNAKEADLLPVPYYRMYLRPIKHSPQHNLLLELEKNGQEVYYAAPQFHTSTELNRHYLRKTVLQNSSLLSPKFIGKLPDDEEHYVVFKAGSKVYFCSEPKEVSATPSAEIISSLFSKISDFGRPVNDAFFLSISDRLLNIYRKSIFADESDEAEVATVSVEEAEEPSFDLSEFLSDRWTEERLRAYLHPIDYAIVLKLRNLNYLRELRYSADYPYQYAHYVCRNLFECELLLAVNRQ